MSRIRTIGFALIALFLMNMLLGESARAAGGSGGDDRAASRWTLAEWLETRDRNRMMDLWLSMHSPSPFETMIGGSYLSTKTGVDPAGTSDSFTHYDGEVRAYMQFVGLTAEYANHTQENFNDLSGMLNLRLFGDSLQNSSLTLHFGQRARTLVIGGNNNIQRNLFSQVSLQLYVSKFFGIDGFYRHYEPSVNDVLKEEIRGSLAEAGLFIDFKSVRVFGAWTQDRQINTTTAGAETTTTREGVKTGLRIYY